MSSGRGALREESIVLCSSRSSIHMLQVQVTLESFMTRPIDRFTLLSRFGILSLVAITLCVAPTYAQDGGGEPPIPPEDEPILEEEDDIVIPDTDEVIDEGIVEVEDDIVIPDDNSEELVLEEEPVLTPAELAAIAEAERKAWEQELGQRTLQAANAAAAAGKWREAANRYSEASQYLPNNPEIIRGLNTHTRCSINPNFLLNTNNAFKWREKKHDNYLIMPLFQRTIDWFAKILILPVKLWQVLLHV